MNIIVKEKVIPNAISFDGLRVHTFFEYEAAFIKHVALKMNANAWLCFGGSYGWISHTGWDSHTRTITRVFTTMELS